MPDVCVELRARLPVEGWPIAGPMQWPEDVLENLMELGYL
jgi:hypothetical protein